MTMTPEQAAKLRAPFLESQIGLLPKPTKRDAPIGYCKVCEKNHGLPAVHLSYVGHAATTDRLLQVDPSWSWEPVAYGEDGLPKLDSKGGLWIRLTICGVTRLGYGDEAMGKGMKEMIGDAIRNAAMRFGVALDLWSKEDLTHKGDDEPAKEGEPAKKPDPKPEAKPIDMGALVDRVNACETEDALRDLWNKLEADEKTAAKGYVNARKKEIIKAASEVPS